MRKGLCGRGGRSLELVRNGVRPARGIADQTAVQFNSPVIQPLSGIRVACVPLIW